MKIKRNMQIESTHLGKQSNYPQHYDPNVLVAVPRILNRQLYGIDNDNLNFTGVDVWHAYEFSFLLKSGLPVTGILKIVYSAESEFLVESKSLKLYLNSFNMDRYGLSVEEGLNEVIPIIIKDLSTVLKTEVKASYFDCNACKKQDEFSGYLILENSDEIKSVSFDDYSENTCLLNDSSSSGMLKWGSHLLRSNCKITLQPDWGSVYISMKSKKLPAKSAFLKYIVSLRNENHFHEEICEMIFTRLINIYNPSELTVSCLYTRRGGIDINPVRSMKRNNFPKLLTNHEVLTKMEFRQ